MEMAATAWQADRIRLVAGEALRQETRDRIGEALRTLRCLPGPVGPAGHRCGLPDPVRTFWECYAQEAARLARTPPSALEIDRMDEALPWLWLILDPRHRAVVCLRALGCSWRRVADMVGCSHEAARQWEPAAIARIAQKRIDNFGRN